ncbi:ribosomal subunit interface protein [Allostella sp. ATCC 35155]|nr:ribosomal subunit interface protein [Stella sp. ATCC 35155]
MQIQVNTDESIEGRDALTADVEATVTATLGQFRDHLTRVEVHISDENAGKSGQNDKRCMMEARPEHQKPVAVTHKAATVDEACAGAAKKLRSLLQTHFGKLHDVKGGPSIRDNELT